MMRTNANEDTRPLRCAKCGHAMAWNDVIAGLDVAQLIASLNFVMALRPGDELVLARCRVCGHEVSITPADDNLEEDPR